MDRRRHAPRTRSRRGGCLIISLVVCLILLVAGLGTAWWMHRQHVVLEPGEHISREAIQQIIAQESPIYYADGETALGVFFAREHRVYVPYEDIPEDWVNAIVAAEDKNYWDHRGVDPEGIARAIVKNVQAGGLVAGGSTLTQQTAKNIYYRPDRSLKSKGKEAVNALRLEAHHSKEDILEFYANQFHVSGNGRGIGIAARYFFDKEVRDLTTLESAFIAGLVKAPAWYDPFIGSTEERREAAKAKAQARTAYVLRRMWEDGHLTKTEYEALKEQEIPFKQGTFRYGSSVLVDEVQRRLNEAPFPELFTAAGIDNPSTAGVQIVTTLDADAQRASTYSLWHHLSEIGPLLEGAVASDFLHPDARVSKATRPWKGAEFAYARVTGTDGDTIQLDLGGYPGALDADALERGGLILTRAANGDRWARVDSAQIDALRRVLKTDAIVWVSVRPGSDAAPYACDLEIRPELQGGVLVLEDGQIRAMVGGNDNRDFNRAIAAKRQLGSTWKSLVYYAALQLNWTPTDLIDNRRGVFPFEGTWYYPRPDHKAPDFVTLSWAGVNSENLGSIWMLYHLTDRLNDEQIRRLAELTDLAQRDNETDAAYLSRIRDEYGVIATRDRVEMGLLYDVKEQVVADLAFSGRPEDALELRSLHYGWGFERERARQRGDAARTRSLESDFLYLERLSADCAAQIETLRAAMEPVAAGSIRAPTLPSSVDLISVREIEVGEDGAEAGYAVACGRAPEGYVPAAEAILPELERIDLEAAEAAEAARRLAVERLAAERALERQRSLLETVFGRADDEDEPSEDEVGEDDDALADLPALPPLLDDPLLASRLHASTIQAVRRAIDVRAEEVASLDPYDPELLYLHPDFRVMLGMRYVAGLANALGVQSELPPVLSLPLGAVEISLEEAAGVYQGFQGGQTWRFPGERFEPGAVPGLRDRYPVAAPEAPTLLISKILDRDGNVLYQATPQAETVADDVSGRLTMSILRNVVRFGTGRRAAGLPWPVGGKTGTTNEFRNAAFIGYAPVHERGELTAERAVVVASYVGYDDNRPLKRGRSRLSGASAALPAWLGTVEGMGALGLLGEPAPGQELSVDPGYVSLPVIAEGGLPADDPAEALGAGRLLLAWGDADAPTRRFAPFAEPAQETSGASEALPEEDDQPEAIEDPSTPAGDTDVPIPPSSIWDGIE